MGIIDIAVMVLLAAGSFLALTSAVGVLRFPDFFSRVHPAGKIDTMGVLLFALAMLLMAIQLGYTYVVWGRLLLMVLFIYFSGPVACHAITKAAYLDGLKAWSRGDKRP